MLSVEKRKFPSAIVVMVMAALLAKSSESAAVTPRCSGKMDVLLIMDGSSSVGTTDFQTGLAFSANLSEQFTVGPNDVQFSLMTYSTRNYNVFGFQDHLTNDRVKQAILTASYPGGLTNTGSALRNARTYSFGSANGARKDVFQAAVVMTDGQSTDVGDTKTESLLFHNLGVSVIAVGVGSAVDLEELRAIASSPSLAFSVSSYTTLSSIKNELSSKICEEQTKGKHKTCGTFSCVGKRDGTYPACSPECQRGFYYSCSSEHTYNMPCPLGWYTAANGTRFTAPTVYEPKTNRCELETECCPRETEKYSVPPPNPGNVNPPPSNRACIDSSSNCAGRQNGNYPICHPNCQSGFYYSCSNNETYVRPCAPGWYTDANNNSYTARMVYDAGSDSCQLSTPSCPRDSKIIHVPPTKSPEPETPPATPRCDTRLSLLYLMDSSGSIGFENYKIMLNFASSIASSFSVGVDSSRIGAIIFSDSVEILFDLSTYSTTEDVRQALENAPYHNGGTQTHLALDLARQLLCSPTSGAPDNLPKVVILLTDGISNYPLATEAAGRKLKNCGVKVLSVGVGPGANKRELLAVATSPEHVYEVDNFNILSRIRSGLVTGACNKTKTVGPCINSTRNCVGRSNGNYPACYPECQAGNYYTCSNNNTYQMPCPSHWYTDKNNNRFTEKMVYDPASDSCVPEVEYCPRELTYKPSTPSSTQEPTKDTTTAPIPQCKTKADIALIMDSSGSIHPRDFDKMKTFAAGLVDYFTVASDGVRFSVIVFSSVAEIEFPFTDYSTATSVKQAIQRISYRPGGTNTAAALKLAREQVFTSKGGARSGVSYNAIVLTDGASNDPSETALEAGTLKTLANIFCVGIGSGINVQELRTIASSPNQTFNATSFDVLDQIKRALVVSTCQKSGPKTTTEPPPSCVIETCEGLPAGTYPACGQLCKEGYYYVCANQQVYRKSCPPVWYTSQNNTSFQARSVFDPTSQACQNSSTYCQRDPEHYKV